MNEDSEQYQLYWGDLHSHCAVSYGFGTPERAFACAREQLDFCSVTGHAFWPDMPTDRSAYAKVIDQHEQGFARLRENWPHLTKLVQEQETPGVFIPFPSYEWHSMEFGDHNVYFRDTDVPLVNGSDLNQLEEKLRALDVPFMMIPHHIGYRPGYRGIDWQHFSEDRSPLVEIFSLHGSSESDLARYPQMHTMGPRHYASTAEYALRRGIKFGMIASTDHHGGFPGSYGDGRVGVWARDLSRSALWEGMTRRRTCAVTGDKIAALLRVNGHWPGESITGGQRRRLDVDVAACDFIDYVEILKNEVVLERINGAYPADSADLGYSASDEIEAKVRIEWGWGHRETRRPIEADLTVLGGSLEGVEPCFRGETILSPDDTLADPDSVPHRVTRRDESSCAWQSLAVANPSPRQEETQSLIATVRMSLGGRLALRVNELSTEVSLRDLLTGSQSFNLRGWLSEAVRIHRAVPRSHYRLTQGLDDGRETACDVYRIRVAQRNGQWAWTSPLWVMS